MYDWSTALQDRKHTDIVYFDFQKAFDSVSHSKLTLKLQAYGINGNLKAWIVDFLSNRTQYVRVHEALSNPSNVTSGVPQGSVLGPTLFLIYINDVVENITCKTISIKLFADDIKFYSSSSSSTCDLQMAIDELMSWSKKWQLNLALQKCVLCSIYHGKGCVKQFSNYFIGDHELENVDQMRDLGITIDENLTFKNHIHNITHTAAIRSRLIHRSFTSGNQLILAKAFCTYIRPLLEYCSSVWSPHHRFLIHKIEKIQRRFTKNIPSLRHTPYPARLKILGLQSLEYRRLILDLSLCYKILHGNVGTNLVQHFHPSNHPATRGHSYKLQTNVFSIDVTKYFFSNRIVKIWNSLPDEVVSSTTFSGFKYLVAKIDLSVFLSDVSF
mgnify:FL=1